MTEQYDSVERTMGIEAYADPTSPGFAAVSKARYSDFVVHEVDVDGNMARLDSLSDNMGGKEEDDGDGDDAAKQTKKEEEEGSQEAGTTSIKRGSDTEDIADQPGSKKAKAEGGAAVAKKPALDVDVNAVREQKLKDAQVELARLVGEDAAVGAIAMLKRWESKLSLGTTASSSSSAIAVAQEQDDGSTNKAVSLPSTTDTDDDEKNYTLPLIDDKEKRRAVHVLIRSDLLEPYALADTLDKRVRIWHKSFEREMPNYGKFDSGRANGGGGGGRGGRRSGPRDWPRDRPDYLKFVLYKENLDTGTAAREISHLLRRNGGGRGGGGRGRGRGRGGRGGGRGGDVNYAGMKDKRGVTSQFVTVYRQEPRDVLQINERASGRGGSGGGSTSGGGLSLMKVGNFSYTSESVGLGALGGNRFDLVLRNVGIPGDGSSTSDPGDDRIAATKAVLESAAQAFRESGFINYFGMQRFGKYYDTHLTGIEVIKGKFEAAVAIIMRPKADEDSRHSDARKRWASRFDGVDTTDRKAMDDAEMKCARDVSRDLGRFMTCEMSLMNALSRKPRQYKRAFQCIAKNMRLMFVHSYQSHLWNRAASHRIETGGSRNVSVGDLVLTEDKSQEEGGSGTSGLKGKSVKALDEADVQSGKYDITDVVLPLAGTKIEYPRNSTGESFDTMLAEADLRKEDLGKIQDRELALGGDYRKVLCKPNDFDFEIKTYRNTVQPLLQTDLMKLKGVEVPHGCSDGPGEAKDEGDGAKSKAMSDEEGEANQSVLLGMVVGFTLPPSSYATIALRELMKRPTSSDYQRGLELSGNCERNIGKRSEGATKPVILEVKVNSS